MWAVCGRYVGGEMVAGSAAAAGGVVAWSVLVGCTLVCPGAVVGSLLVVGPVHAALVRSIQVVVVVMVQNCTMRGLPLTLKNVQQGSRAASSGAKSNRGANTPRSLITMNLG